MIRLARPSRGLPVISIIPLIDVLLILLVFFMVTSTFLDLDMLPLTAPEGAGGAQGDARTVFLRVLPGGSLAYAGQTIPPAQIDAFLTTQIGNRILLLPSPQAELQALVSVLDSAERLGLASVDIIRFEEAR